MPLGTQKNSLNCAIICVEMIIEAQPRIKRKIDDGVYHSMCNKDFYTQVLTELETKQKELWI